MQASNAKPWPFNLEDAVGRIEPGKVPAGLFRFGFICYPAADDPKGDDFWAALVEIWPSLKAGDFLIRHHPETRVRHHVEGGTHVVVMGHAFPVARAGRAELARQIAIAAGDDNELFALLDDLSGRYAILVVTPDGKARLFHDATGTRPVYYRAATPCAASHAALLAHAYGVPLRDDTVEFMRSPAYPRGSIRYLPGDATVYRGVFVLVANNYFDLSSGSTVRYWPRRNREGTTFESVAEFAADTFSALARFLKGYDPIIGCTGGIDSRTLIAALAHQGIKLRAVTWSSLAQDHERPIVEEIVRQLRLRHDWLESATEDRLGAFAMVNAGYIDNRMPYITAMSDLYRRLAKPMFISGAAGEVLRGHVNYRLMSDFSPAGMALTYARDPVLAENAFIRQAFEQYFVSANMETLKSVGYDPNDHFYWEHRQGIGLSSARIRMDVAMDSIVGFSNRRLYELALGLDESIRLTKHLFAEIVRRYNVRLSDIPYGATPVAAVATRR